MSNFTFTTGLELKLQEKFNSIVTSKLGATYSKNDLQSLANRFWSFYTIKKVNCYFPNVLISNFNNGL